MPKTRKAFVLLEETPYYHCVSRYVNYVDIHSNELNYVDIHSKKPFLRTRIPNLCWDITILFGGPGY